VTATGLGIWLLGYLLVDRDCDPFDIKLRDYVAVSLMFSGGALAVFGMLVFLWRAMP